MATLAPSLASLRAEINTRWPGRDKASDGWIGDPAHAARTSRHNPDASGVVHALDVDKDGADGPNGVDIGQVIAEHLRARRDPRTNVVIYRGRLFSSYATSTRRAWTWGPYSGPNAHMAHVHVDVGLTDADEAAGPWGLLTGAGPVLGRPTPTLPARPTTPTRPAPTLAPAPQEDDDMVLIYATGRGHALTNGVAFAGVEGVAVPVNEKLWGKAVPVSATDYDELLQQAQRAHGNIAEVLLDRGTPDLRGKATPVRVLLAGGGAGR